MKGYWGPDADGDWIVYVLGTDLAFAVPDESKARAIVDAIRAQGIETEEWRPSPVFGDRYEVSTFGRVRSVYGVKSPYRDKDGYPTVNLHRGGKRRACNVHRLVALAFHAVKKNALHCEVAHLDGARENCRADNLQWVSKVENHSHKRRHGTHQAGEQHPRAKLTANQVAEIRRRGGTGSELASQYGVSRHTIYDIWQGVSWLSPKGESPVRQDAPK